MFFDTYIFAANEAILASFCRNFSATLGPRKGRAAMPESVNEAGEITPAQQAAGDPALFYACLRTSTPDLPALPEGLSFCSATEGCAVLGLWA